MRVSKKPSPLAREIMQLLSGRKLTTAGILLASIGILLMIPATKTPAKFQNASDTRGFGNAKSLPGNPMTPTDSKAQGLNENRTSSGTANKPSDAGTGTTTPANSQGGLQYPLPVVPLLRLSASPSTADVTRSAATILITSQDGTPIQMPTVTFPLGAGVNASVDWQSPPSDFPGGVYRSKTWTATISRYDYSSSGNTVVTFNIPGAGSADVHVSWSPAPEFAMTKGALTRTETDDTITYTAHFTIQPDNPYFGHPQLTMHIVNTPECINTGTLAKVVSYDGINDYSLDCTVQKAPAQQPGSPPPPMATSLSINVEAYGNLPDGSFIKSPGQPLYFTTPSPYNR